MTDPGVGTITIFDVDPGIVTAETLANRALTDAFIATRPITVTLTPYAPVRSATGALILTAQTSRAPQVMRIVELGRSSANSLVQPTGDGEQLESTFQLLGVWNSIMDTHDRFVLDGRQCVINAILMDNPWERRAEVTRYGD